MQGNWITGPASTRSQEVALVQAVGGQSVARDIFTAGKMIMKAAALRDAVGSLPSVCEKLGCTVPESVPLYFGQVVEWLRVGRVF